jgi:HK97 gp10 family phage protein
MAGIIVTAKIDNLTELREKLKQFPNVVASKLLASALRKAIKPAEAALRAVTPQGPTGNLARAVNTKVKTYTKDGAAVGLVGFNRSGKGASRSAAGGSVDAGTDRAFHQGFVEFGTKQRLIDKFSDKPYQRKSKKGLVHWVSGQNAYIASSFNWLGPFKMLPTPRPPRGKRGHRVETDPAYQKAFFKKSRNPIVLNAMPRGGKSGNPPIEAAWRNSQGEVAQILSDELSVSIDDALQAVAMFMTKTVSGGN